MIDERRIEEAAFDFNDGELTSDKLNRAAFVCGAKWMQEEFLKDLWHSYDEVPTRKDSNILLFFEDYSTGTEDDYDEYFDLANTREGFTQETWEDFMNIGGAPSKWLYIDDLFIKEGDKK